MKQLFLFFVASLLSGTLYATPARVTDGKVQFASTTVNGELAYTQEEHLALVAKYQAMGGTTTVSIVPITPTSNEINLSTTVSSKLAGIIIPWESLSEYLSCQTRLGIIRKYRMLKPLIDTLTDLVYTGDDAAARIRWLKAYYQSLP